MTPEAKAVREAYKLRRQMHQPNWNASNSRWIVCWEKTAAMLERNNIELEPYMDAQFELKSPFPMPNQIYSDTALERYKSYLKTMTDPSEEVIRRLEVEVDFLESRLDLGFDLDEILFFPGAPLTPLFCYCIAMLYSRNDLVDVFEEGAKKQLSRSPISRFIYKSLLEDL